MKLNLNPIKGTNDYAPKEALEREIVRQKILEIYQKNGYQLIKTPILEHLELLNGSDGGDNLKLIFKTIKRGEKLDLSKPNLTEADIAEEGLRYDLTVPLARFYCQNKESLTNPFKSIQIDEAFRAERPQKGRLREFVQCDIDVFGDSTNNAEIDLLSTIVEAYKHIGFGSLTIRLSDRRALNQIMEWSGFDPANFSTVAVSADKIGDIGKEGVAQELTQKELNLSAISKFVAALDDIQQNGAKVLSNYGVGDEVVDNIQTVVTAANNAIAALGLSPKQYNVVFDISIVRGQGYYTGTVFEMYTQGFARAVGGGGRYDNMVEKLIGQKVPAVGCSMGFEPITMLLKQQGTSIKTNKLIALFYNPQDSQNAFKAKAALKQTYDVSLFVVPKNMKNTLERLKNNGFDGYVFADRMQVTLF